MMIYTATNLIAEEDWSAIQETLYLLSIPGMGKSIKKGLKIPLKNCNKDLTW
jgi:antitoxin YefM